ncbi:MAG: hypothetical protein IJK89_09370 [Clostridia bacterium]|nr:hypothetical protein [Clostridia bacterium]
MKKSTLFSMIICAALVIAVPVTVWAIKTGQAPKATSGSFRRQIVDRIDFAVENTEFTLKKPKSGPQDYTVSFYISAEKTQADFYGRIDSVRVTGIDYDNIVFRPQNENCDGLTLNDLLLPVKDGEPAEVEWKAELTFTAADTKSLSPVIEIIYTSGMTQQTADTHILEIPLSITFE